jgi:Uma2 family endonuclease
MATPTSRELEEIELALQSQEGAQYEFVGGELSERHVSTESSRTATRFVWLLMNHVTPRGLGEIYDSELGIRIFSDPMETRRADVSFVSAARAPQQDSGYLNVPPDLVVEVVSPGDNAARLRAKVRAWLGANVRLVWVAYPEDREIQVYRTSGESSILSADDEITGEDVIPGFATKVRELFPS